MLRSRALAGTTSVTYRSHWRQWYLVVESGRHQYCLKSEHAHFADRQGARVHYLAAEAVTIGLAGAKNDQALYHVLRARAELRQNAAPNLCVDLRAGEVSDRLKAVASSIGVDPHQYATHSVRIGGATALLSGEADGLAIKLLGRWLSNTYESYPVLGPEATLGLSSHMI
ncbi:hypothetical protein PHYSODRAFT_335049 [Phytophthora sojae]|uniref:Tyr recombinase domain-containing protein n=1 Tax=Phytophthora sojae (strain P6497) TaxID=1094619 RepID=G4ZU13_PHYSP|nr:hypothetical protein PHYSODRAFT_335049 [Phytophthora sojae]EGZ13287.1 hypothetical protein PHYSODRAFT_335049 [Phytophthora sojae]|eukprot:XP_009530716.1 hypothetical protein PHYSODRAFT_335049 [Phytophthora sojae]